MIHLKSHAHKVHSRPCEAHEMSVAATPCLVSAEAYTPKDLAFSWSAQTFCAGVTSGVRHPNFRVKGARIRLCNE
jgi:hypothetical protein